MGRKFPTGENPTINPILSFSLLIACVVSIIAIISSLCGSFLRKKESSSPEINNSNDVFSQQNEVTKTLGDPLVTSPAENADVDDMSSIMSHSYQKPLPPPPPADMRHSRASSYHFQSNSIASFGRLTSSMSMRVQGGLSGLRQSSRREDSNSDKKKEKYFKHEDSIWKKQIILGEKCIAPDHDDTIICDEKRNRISTYHPKTPSSLALSRQSSSIDPTAIPS